MFLPILRSLGTSSLSVGSVDGLKMFVESTVTGNHMNDGSVARFVFNEDVVKLTNDGELIRSSD